MFTAAVFAWRACQEETGDKSIMALMFMIHNSTVHLHVFGVPSLKQSLLVLETHSLKPRSHACMQPQQAENLSWAAHHNTWLPIKPTANSVLFFFSFFPENNSMSDCSSAVLQGASLPLAVWGMLTGVINLSANCLMQAIQTGNELLVACWQVSAP